MPLPESYHTSRVVSVPFVDGSGTPVWAGPSCFGWIFNTTEERLPNNTPFESILEVSYRGATSGMIQIPRGGVVGLAGVTSLIFQSRQGASARAAFILFHDRGMGGGMPTATEVAPPPMPVAPE